MNDNIHAIFTQEPGVSPAQCVNTGLSFMFSFLILCADELKMSSDFFFFM